MTKKNKSSKEDFSSQENNNKIKQLEEKLKECEKEKEDYLASWKRAKADYLNHKKEESVRIEKIIKNANEEMILKILPIVDNLELAENNLTYDFKEDDFIKGMIQIKKQIKNILIKEGLEEIETKEKKFDPKVHEAIEEVEKKDTPSGMIVEEIQKGYKLNGKIIRPSKVKTAK